MRLLFIFIFFRKFVEETIPWGKNYEISNIDVDFTKEEYELALFCVKNITYITSESNRNLNEDEILRILGGYKNEQWKTTISDLNKLRMYDKTEHKELLFDFLKSYKSSNPPITEYINLLEKLLRY